MIYVNARAIIEREGAHGTELLLQVAERPGSRPTLEFPGGRLEEFEPVLQALAREVLEETGLTLTRVLDETERCVATVPGPVAEQAVEVECLKPFFVYQTTRGPVDSVGFFFRCHAQGSLTAQGDAASGHRWVSVAEVARQFSEAPAAFHWLTGAALTYYLRWRGAVLPGGPQGKQN